MSSSLQPPTTPIQPPTTPIQSTTPSLPHTPRQPSPLHTHHSPFSPPTPSNRSQRYDSSVLSSPTPSEALNQHAVVYKAFKQDLAAQIEEEVELNEVSLHNRTPTTPDNLPDSGKTLEESPFHNSQAIVVDKHDWRPTSSGGHDSTEWTDMPKSASFPYDQGDHKVHQTEDDTNSNRGDIPEYTPPKGTLKLLFHPCTRQDVILRIIPAIILAAGVSIVPMWMTILVGDAFGAFSGYPLDYRLATAEQSATMLKDISKACLILTVVGLAGWVGNCTMVWMWVRIGELVTHRLRGVVYQSVMDRGMEWFDMGMGLRLEDEKDDANGIADDGEENVGAGGLMSKFTR